MTIVTLTETTEYRIDYSVQIDDENRDVYAFFKDGIERYQISVPAGTTQAEAFEILAGIQSE